MLKRAELRRDIVDLLKGKTTAGQKVYDSLPFRTANNECPCILVYAPQENASARAKHVSMFDSSLTISIEARVAEDYLTAMQTLDTLCENIENLILSDQDFLQSVEAITAINTQIGQDDGGEYPLFLAIISVTVEYKKDIRPDIQDQFLTARVNVDAIDPYDQNLASSGPDGRIEGQAIINIEQG